MPLYKLSIQHIDSEFGFGPDASSQWSTRIGSDQELAVFLNRVAIATSTEAVMEYPEVEITADSRRATVTAVDGHLYYTELDAHKQNLKVVAEDVLKLLKGIPFQAVVEVDDVDEAEEIRHYAHAHSNRNWRLLGWAILFSILFSCGFIIWKEIRYQPRLIEKPKFVEVSEGRSETLRDLAGVYVHEYREGGMIFEIIDDGRLEFYELWESRTSKGFVRLPLESHELKIGLHMGKEAYLAGDVHLIKLAPEGALELHGMRFFRFEGKRRDLGPIRRSVP